MGDLFSSKQMKTLPYTTRTFYLLLIAFQIAQVYYDKWSSRYLSSNLQGSVLNYQLWRPFFYFLYEPSVLIVLVTIVHLQLFLPRFELQNGSIVLVYEIMAISICIEIMILGYQLCVYLATYYQLIQGFSLVYASGVAGLTVNVVYKFLHFNLRKHRKFASKQGLITFLYPLFLAMIFWLCSGECRIDAFFGFILAWIECTFFKGGIVFFTPDTYTKKETLVEMCRLNRIPCCRWSPLNEGKIKPNSKCVVQAHQFYIFTLDELNKVDQTDFNEMETERGAFERNMEMTEQEMEGRDEKWEREQTVQ